MRNVYRIQVGDWKSKETYNYYGACQMKKRVKGCFKQRVMAVRER